MKKLLPAILLLLAVSGLHAQYKKASFFGKAGRTYELGAQLYSFGDGKGSPIGYKIGFGSDQEGKRFFYCWDLALLPSYKYAFTTTDENDVPVAVNGVTKTSLIYTVHFNFHLLNNDADNESRIKPYVTAGLNTALVGGIKSEIRTPDAYDLKMQTPDYAFTAGVGGGLGCLFNFTSVLGLKLQGGYNYQFHINNNRVSGIKYYQTFSSHPYVSLGLRLRLAAE